MKHKNKIEIKTITQQKVIRKEYLYAFKKQNEQTYLELLKGKINVPTIILKEQQSLLLTYYEGKTCKQYFEQYEQENNLEDAKKLLNQVIEYLKTFHKLTDYKVCKNDNHLDNYIVHKDEIYGLDFEETKFGDYKEDYANLLAFYMSYDPQNSAFKQDLYQYGCSLLEGIIDLQLVENHLAKIQLRRTLKQQDIACCIVAGGKATRMNGIDKGQLRLGSRTFLDELSNTFSSMNKIYLSVSKKRHRVSLLPKIYDEFEDIGPIGAIYTVLKNTKENALFFIACDSPFITRTTIQQMQLTLLESNAHCVLAINESGDYQPLCAIYTKHCLPVLEKMIKEKQYRLMHLFPQINTQTYKVSNKELQNINTYEAYQYSKIGL